MASTNKGASFETEGEGEGEGEGRKGKEKDKGRGVGGVEETTTPEALSTNETDTPLAKSAPLQTEAEADAKTASSHLVKLNEKVNEEEEEELVEVEEWDHTPGDLSPAGPNFRKPLRCCPSGLPSDLLLKGGRWRVLEMSRVREEEEEEEDLKVTRGGTVDWGFI